jgi:hypothetical protein
MLQIDLALRTAQRLLHPVATALPHAGFVPLQAAQKRDKAPAVSMTWQIDTIIVFASKIVV